MSHLAQVQLTIKDLNLLKQVAERSGFFYETREKHHQFGKTINNAAMVTKHKGDFYPVLAVDADTGEVHYDTMYTNYAQKVIGAYLEEQIRRNVGRVGATVQTKQVANGDLVLEVEW